MVCVIILTNKFLVDNGCSFEQTIIGEFSYQLIDFILQHKTFFLSNVDNLVILILLYCIDF